MYYILTKSVKFVVVGGSTYVCFKILKYQQYFFLLACNIPLYANDMNK
jgi:hypothetical protein